MLFHKNFLLTFFLILITFSGFVQSQTQEFYCPHDDPITHSKAIQSSSFLRDGESITAHGELRVLMVFIRFPDDNQDWSAAFEGNRLKSKIFIQPNTLIGLILNQLKIK